MIGVPVFLLFYSAPTCSDGRLNGDETGVDCGGSCQRLCSVESLPLILKGDPRILTVATSTYEVVVLLENANADAEIRGAEYSIKLFGSSSLIPLKVIVGRTYIPQGATFAIFEGPFALEEGVAPIRATLEWQENTLVWEKRLERTAELVVQTPTLTRTEASPRLEVVVRNPSSESVSNIDLIALISDKDGNIFAASKTFIDRLEAGAESQAIFTWPRPFTSTAVEIKIIPRVFPDRSYIR